MEKVLIMQQIPGFGLKKIKNFLNVNKSFLNDDDYFEYLIYSQTGINIESLNDKVKFLKEECYKLGITICKYNNENIVDYPLVLYLKGNNELLRSKKKLSVVGTRYPRNSSKILGRNVVKQAVENGWVIISGFAKGCDFLAHNESIKNGGETIAVLPMGYKTGVAPWILDNGLIISEYPPNTKIEKFRCINRNRIITGLSMGLFVIEADEGSGSEHSLRYANQMKIPISYGFGFKGISKYTNTQIRNRYEFDLFLKKCLK